MANENPNKSPEAEAVAEVIPSTSGDRTSATFVPISTRYYGMALLIGIFACGFFAFIFLAFKPGPGASTTLIGFTIAGIVAFFIVWFSVCGAYFFKPNSYGMIIDSAGVHERYASGETAISWSNIRSIELDEVEGGSVIAFSLRERPRWVWGFGAYDYYLVNFYALPQSELFALLRARHAHAMQTLDAKLG